MGYGRGGRGRGGGGGGGGGRGAYYKALYGGGGRGRGRGRGGGGGGGGYGGASSFSDPSSRADATSRPAAPTRTFDDLKRTLQRIHGKGYGAYRDVEGIYSNSDVTLLIDRVQGDPYAAPSRVRVRIPNHLADFPPDLTATRLRRVALADFLQRAFAKAVAGRRLGVGSGRGGGGYHGPKGGEVTIETPGQHILERSGVVFHAQKSSPVAATGVGGGGGGGGSGGGGGGGGGGDPEARLTVGLPASGRSVEGEWAWDILGVHLPEIATSTLRAAAHDADKLRAHVISHEDQHYLRVGLADAGLVAFVADGAVLPRASGASDAPLTGPDVVRFVSPGSLAREFALHNGGSVRGMGIPRGVTLIVGGGFHGKSTLLRALEVGVYNHIPGDGREFVVADALATKIRAEDGRAVNSVNVSNFIGALPGGRDTRVFSTRDASGSTSQAANIAEAIETGARALLIDEDTSATNFMVRDARMRRLIGAREPITPFLFKVRSLARDHNVSSILVVGGCGDYFDVTDTVICMDNFLPRDATLEARAISEELPTELPQDAASTRFAAVTPRTPLTAGLDARRQDGKEKVTARGQGTLLFGEHEIDLCAVEQLVEVGQTRAIGDAILLCRDRFMGAGVTLAQVATQLDTLLESEGLDTLRPGWQLGNFTRPRLLEFAAALNRFRALNISVAEVP